MTYKAYTFLYAIVVAVFALGGMCGGFVGGYVANKLGRLVVTMQCSSMIDLNLDNCFLERADFCSTTSSGS